MLEEQEYIRQQLRSKSTPYKAPSVPASSSKPETTTTSSNPSASAAQNFADFEEFEAMVLKQLADAAAAQKQSTNVVSSE